jgi:hypothetical protein
MVEKQGNLAAALEALKDEPVEKLVLGDHFRTALTAFTDADMALVPAGVKELEVLDATYVSDAGIASLPKSVETLDLRNINVPITKFKGTGLTALPQLRALELHGSAITYETIGNLPNGLDKLTLRGTSLTDAHMALVPAGVKELEILNATYVSDAGIASLPKSVETLDLRDIKVPITKIKGTGFTALPQLRTLTLRSSVITDEMIGNLPNGLDKLTLFRDDLKRYDYPRFTGTGLQAVPNLRELTVHRCPDLTDEAMASMTQLEKLKVNFCSQLSIKAFAPMTRLRELDLVINTKRPILIELIDATSVRESGKPVNTKADIQAIRTMLEARGCQVKGGAFE